MRAWLLAAILAPAPAFADVVVLSDGHEIDGVVVSEADPIVVELGFGSVSFPKSEVREIRREHTALSELEQRRARLDANDIAGRFALAKWAEDHDLVERARELYREVLALRPDDSTAHERLGHRRHEGRWLAEEEYLVATGHIRYGGEWMTTEEAERRERAANERRARRDEEHLRALESQVALQQKELERLETPPEISEAPLFYSYGSSWWLPTWSSFGYRALLHQPHPTPAPVAQPRVRGQLGTHSGPPSKSVGLRRTP